MGKFGNLAGAGKWLSKGSVGVSSVVKARIKKGLGMYRQRLGAAGNLSSVFHQARHRIARTFGGR